jgi:outer membrane protein TolC
MKKLLLPIILMLCCDVAFSQKSLSYEEMTRKLINTQLPHLDSLFESARINNAIMLMQEKEIEVALRGMKTEQNEWWSFIRPFGTYQYGLMASLVEISNEGIPITPNYTRNAQNWWNVGVSLTFPLEKYIDRVNRIKKEKATMEAQQYSLEVKFDELKIKIAQAYSECVLALTLSKALTDRYNYTKAQYEISEKEFSEGRMTSLELTNAKAQEVNAYVELQEQLSNLIYYVSSLETLTKMKIID